MIGKIHLFKRDHVLCRPGRCICASFAGGFLLCGQDLFHTVHTDHSRRSIHHGKGQSGIGIHEFAQDQDKSYQSAQTDRSAAHQPYGIDGTDNVGKPLDQLSYNDGGVGDLGTLLLILHQFHRRFVHLFAEDLFDAEGTQYQNAADRILGNLCHHVCLLSVVRLQTTNPFYQLPGDPEDQGIGDQDDHK